MTSQVGRQVYREAQHMLMRDIPPSPMAGMALHKPNLKHALELMMLAQWKTRSKHTRWSKRTLKRREGTCCTIGRQ